jgi:hypothetical protein
MRSTLMTKYPVTAVLVLAWIVAAAPSVHAAVGWIAVANSPGHEKLDWAGGPSKASADSIALSNCAANEHASDCRILASSPDCIAVAWDGTEPVNKAHAKSGGGRDVVVPAAIAAAGPHANDVSSRCAFD